MLSSRPGELQTSSQAAVRLVPPRRASNGMASESGRSSEKGLAARRILQNVAITTRAFTLTKRVS